MRFLYVYIKSYTCIYVDVTCLQILCGKTNKYLSKESRRMQQVIVSISGCEYPSSTLHSVESAPVKAKAVESLAFKS